MSGGPLDDTLAAESVLADAPAVLGERYRILAMLGAGGMGNVYKARDLELDELVALKVLKRELLGTPGAVDRFRREVKLARRVTHPNVARVFDIGDWGGDRLLTMELVDGEPLSALLERDHALPVARAVEIASAICAGVAAAHAAAVVHCDLKPDNVLLADDGRVVVTDFGIARALAASEEAKTRGIVGTPAYMAPEQVDEAQPIDERADIYAFGTMLYEMLTGQRAWRGESAIAVAAARLVRPPPDPRGERPDLPPALAQLVLRCMSRQPADRHARIADVAAELSAVTLPELAATGRAGAAALVPLLRPGGFAPASADRRVAVLPFRNLGPNDQEWLADALTDELIDVLSVARGLRVRPRGVVARFKGEARDPREIGRELDVQVVVEGSIRRAAGAFRIQARLISVADGFQLWARRFQGQEANMLVLNDEVARAVADALTADLDAVVREAPGDVETVDLYLRARAANHRFFAGDPRTASELFEQALARSPDDPRLLAGRVMSRARSQLASVDEVPAMLRDAERALHLAPSLPDPHVALGFVLFHFSGGVGACRPLRRALRVAPNYPEAHDLLGRMLSEADRAEGRRHLETALALEPKFEFSRVALARHLALLGEWDAASSVLDGSTQPFESLPARSRFVLWRRDAAAARALLDSSVPSTHIQHLVRASLELTAFGKRPPPEMLEVPTSTKPRARAFMAQLRAEVACLAGDRPAALAEIAASDAQGLCDLAWVERCPLLDLVRGEPEFARVRVAVAGRAARLFAEYLAVDE